MIPAWVGVIGSDRHLRFDELGEDVRGGGASDAWALYRDAFDGYCGSQIDPQYDRFVHPARRVGRLDCTGASVVVVGSGPTLDAGLSTLRRLRAQLHLVTSVRGAEALLRAGLVPDLVLVEHRTALDAHHSARFRRDGTPSPLTEVPLVAATWQTPSTLLEDLDPARLFVPDPLPSWGLWPATLAAMALEGGAAHVGLVGVDLGTSARPDAAFEPLRQLLGLMAAHVPGRATDCGAAGARKPHWPVGTLEDVARHSCGGRLSVLARPAPSPAARLEQGRSTLAAVAPCVVAARRGLDAARAGSARHVAETMQTLLDWGHDLTLRVALQEGLGLAFLPRLWRTGVSPDLGDAVRRPLVLACHELVGQAERLAVAAA
jgi:hypothetical protein